MLSALKPTKGECRLDFCRVTNYLPTRKRDKRARTVPSVTAPTGLAGRWKRE
jgi:hypothetical protein